MGRQAVDEYVERCQQLVEASPQMDEENTKVKLFDREYLPPLKLPIADTDSVPNTERGFTE